MTKVRDLIPILRLIFKNNLDFIWKICNNKYMERTGIFGGTFNPVHREHIRLAKMAVEELNLDKLIIMPTYQPPHKATAPLPAEHRLKMLRRAFSGEQKIEISDYEIEKKGTSYTYLTVEHFKKQTGAHLFFIVGGDMLVNFKTWKYPERILAVCDLAVFEREQVFTDFEKEREYFKQVFGKEFIKLNFVGKNFSSTKLRVYSAFSLPLDELTAPAVSEYIKENNLYSGNEYIEYAKKVLPEKRLKHTANVVVSALSKAKDLGLDQQKVIIATTLHDVAKYYSGEIPKDANIDKETPQPVVHAFLGAYIAEKKLKITDKDIINAIRYHTTGRANMSLLEKLVFVADMVEEDRDYQGVKYLRDLFNKDDFEFCFRECLREEFIHLLNKKTSVHIETINAYDFYLGAVNNQKN